MAVKDAIKELQKINVQRNKDLQLKVDLGFFDQEVWIKQDFLETGVKESAKGNSKAHGVYKTIYRGDVTEYEGLEVNKDEVFGIGAGRLSQRLQRVRDVFQNNGQTIQSENSASDCQLSKKMYKMDSNPDNWYFSHQQIGDEAVSLLYEKQLQQVLKPRFSCEHMAGK
mgnify:CR=1 FL=1